jgi:energy-coupling factor transport system permease protein
MTEGEVIYQLGFLKITREGLVKGLLISFRLFILILTTSLLTLATSPISLTDGMERLLSVFKFVGIPAHEIAMMMTIALRFIPTLLEETEKIMKAQISELAIAMEAKCYRGGEGRTHYRELKIKKTDILIFALTVVITVMVSAMF